MLPFFDVIKKNFNEMLEWVSAIDNSQQPAPRIESGNLLWAKISDLEIKCFRISFERQRSGGLSRIFFFCLKLNSRVHGIKDKFWISFHASAVFVLNRNYLITLSTACNQLATRREYLFLLPFSRINFCWKSSNRWREPICKSSNQ